jgi:curli biogenesis system outer membrane secretion channel CsgG
LRFSGKDVERNGSCPLFRGEGFSLSKISATVSAFEENTSGKDAGFSFMGVSVGDDKGKAYMAVELKVMDTNTGEIADARTVKATSESSGMRLGLKLGFFSGNLGEKAKTPTGKAIRGCIVEISEYL